MVQDGRHLRLLSVYKRTSVGKRDSKQNIVCRNRKIWQAMFFGGCIRVIGFCRCGWFGVDVVLRGGGGCGGRRARGAADAHSDAPTRCAGFYRCRWRLWVDMILRGERRAWRTVGVGNGGRAMRAPTTMAWDFSSPLAGSGLYDSACASQSRSSSQPNVGAHCVRPHLCACACACVTCVRLGICLRQCRGAHCASAPLYAPAYISAHVCICLRPCTDAQCAPPNKAKTRQQ